MAKQPKSLKGYLLLDGGSLAGSFFHRSVVLICQHDSEGAFGLILNRLAGANVGEALPGDLPDRLKELPLMVGGPVQTQAPELSPFRLPAAGCQRDAEPGPGACA